MTRPDHRFRQTALGAVVLLAGCVPLPFGHQLTRRMVASKEGENTLVADDASTCRVKGDEYDKVRVGDRHTCVWRVANGDGGAPAGSDDRRPRRAPGRPAGR